MAQNRTQYANNTKNTIGKHQKRKREKYSNTRRTNKQVACLKGIHNIFAQPTAFQFVL